MNHPRALTRAPFLCAYDDHDAQLPSPEHLLMAERTVHWDIVSCFRLSPFLAATTCEPATTLATREESIKMSPNRTTARLTGSRLTGLLFAAAFIVQAVGCCMQSVNEVKQDGDSEVYDGGDMEPHVYSDLQPVAPTLNLTGTVINVRRMGAVTYIEVNLGAKDGVKEGWVLIVTDGDEYISDVQITKVDIASSIGVVVFQGNGVAAIGNSVRGVKGLGLSELNCGFE